MPNLRNCAARRGPTSFAYWTGAQSRVSAAARSPALGSIHRRRFRAPWLRRLDLAEQATALGRPRARASARVRVFEPFQGSQSASSCDAPRPVGQPAAQRAAPLRERAAGQSGPRRGSSGRRGEKLQRPAHGVEKLRSAGRAPAAILRRSGMQSRLRNSKARAPPTSGSARAWYSCSERTVSASCCRYSMPAAAAAAPAMVVKYGTRHSSAVRRSGKES